MFYCPRTRKQFLLKPEHRVNDSKAIGFDFRPTLQPSRGGILAGILDGKLKQAILYSPRDAGGS